MPILTFKIYLKGSLNGDLNLVFQISKPCDFNFGTFVLIQEFMDPVFYSMYIVHTPQDYRLHEYENFTTN